ncbi:MAG: tetratricopeptide repeat protein [Gammaproteobacteria bacterium]|nr:tetratricopeptide repeat protein [Gammaproteobacteria bacterium]
MNRRFFILLVLFLTGCATGMRTPGPYPQETPAPETQTAPAGPPAVVALLDDAERQARAGQYARAEEDLERALRIDPRNAGVWHRLARLRYAQGQYHQAIQLASKSNTLANDDRPLRARNWTLIADAHDRIGNPAKARAARDKAILD